MTVRVGPLHRMCAVLLLTALATLAAVSAQGRVNVDHTALLTIEHDDNVLRSHSDPEKDFLVRLFYSLDLVYLPTIKHRLELRYLGGGKKYFNLESEDTLVNKVALGYTNMSFNDTWIGISADFKLRNTREGERDYDKLLLLTFYERRLPLDLAININAGIDRFDYIELDYFDYWIHRYRCSLSRAFTRDVSAGLEYGFAQKRFAFGRFRAIGDGINEAILVQGNTRRVDNRHSPRIWLDLRWKMRANFSYMYRINDSNSYGETYSSHVISAAVSIPIVEGLSLQGLGIFQLRATEEEVSIPHSTGIEDEEEHLNAFTARATFQAHKNIIVEAGFSRYWSTELDKDFRFVKDVASMGFKFKF